MKRIPFILVFILCTAIVTAQPESRFSLGMHGGLTFSNITHKNGFPGNYDFTRGFFGGLDLGYKPARHIRIVTTIDYYQNGYNHNLEELLFYFDNPEFTYSYFGLTDVITQEYLNNSWLAAFDYGYKLHMSFMAGIYWAYFIEASFFMTDYTYVDPEEADIIGDPAIPAGYREFSYSGALYDKNFSQLDFGLVAGINIGYPAGRWLVISLNSKFYKGLIDINKLIMGSLEVDYYNNSFSAGIGLTISL